MFFGVYREEVNKIITSNSFKIALLLILICSTYNIISEYRKFSNYDYIYECNRKDYTVRINEYKETLKELESGEFKSIYYSKSSSKEIDIEKYIYHKELEFFNHHQLPPLQKDLSQGLDKSIFQYDYWLPILLLFCCGIVCFERSINIIKIQFSTATSSTCIYHSKYLAMLTAMALIFILNLIFSYFFSGYLMGFSDLSGSMRGILGYSTSIAERGIKEMMILKSILAFITCASSAVIFLFVSTVVRDLVSSYVISALLVTNSHPFYCTLGNGTGIFRYFFISFYHGCERYIRGEAIYSMKVALIAMFIQTLILYVLGLYIYKNVELS